MARPRKPTKHHEISGAIEKNPARFADRVLEPVDDRPLGPPPERLEPEVRVAWEEIGRLAPWLGHADRIAVEVAAVLLAQFRRSLEKTPPQLLTRLEASLGQLGMTPASRSRVSVSTKTPDNPFQKHGARRKAARA